jgi:hypothetical protein
MTSSNYLKDKALKPTLEVKSAIIDIMYILSVFFVSIFLVIFFLSIAVFDRKML